MKICVIALGKIGLPLAVQFAGKGHDVVGLDVNAATVASVNAGHEPFPGEAELATKLETATRGGQLRATTDYADGVGSADIVVVVVPLFVDRDARPDFAPLDAATNNLGLHLRRGALVSYETTLPVGTTRSRWKPMLEATSGLAEGKDFDLVFSPERVLTGRVFADLRRYPKLVGGLNPRGSARAIEFYSAVLDFDERRDLRRSNGVWDLGSAEAAEMAKLAETTYRDVNIGLANQFARFADHHGIDIHAVIEASNSQPYSHIHNPGIAVGGHCIPVYPRLYLWNDPDATIVSAARDVNAAMPQYAIDLLRATHGDLTGERVAVLGASYRGGVKETAFSGVFPTVAALLQCGAIVTVHDPLYSDAELNALGFVPYHVGESVDAIVVQTDHDLYRTCVAQDFPGVRTLVDGRHIIDSGLWPGVAYVTIGASAR